MADYVDRKEELRRYFPAPNYTLTDGEGLALLLDIIGEFLNELDENVRNGKAQFMLSSALGIYLERHGRNRDLYKPVGARMKDPAFRQLVEIVANTPKNTEYIFERVLGVFFGVKALERGYCDVYSIRRNEIIVRIAKTALIVAISRDLLGTTYLHTSEEPYIGNVKDLFTGKILGDYPAATTVMVMDGIPAGMPLLGMIELGDPSTNVYEIKGYTRSANILTFFSPTYYVHDNLSPFQGPKYPNDYTSAYIFKNSTLSTNVGLIMPGDTDMTVIADAIKFGASGLVYIGEPGSDTFEAKAYTRSGTTFTFEGVANFVHQSGELVAIPAMYRKEKTLLNANITVGSSLSTLPVVNAADFPVTMAAIALNRGFDNEEIIPFGGRVIGDNTIMQVDSGYVFKQAHSIGETIHLMAVQTYVGSTGENFPFYVADSDNLKNQFLSILSRLKVAGYRLKIEFY